MSEAPLLDGIHHAKLPVSDLDRSRAWYASRLGYLVEVEFREKNVLMGLALRHPNGGPRLALRLDPDRAAATAGFDYFSIGVPDRTALEDLAERLAELGVVHEGVHYASIGWILPGAHDPDGHEVRFYTTESHQPLSDVPLHLNDVRETMKEPEHLPAEV